MKALFIVFASALFIDVSSFCPPSSFKSTYRNTCFAFYDFPSSFVKAEEFCENEGGHLASIVNAFEANEIWVKSVDSVSNSSFWLGADDLDDMQNYKWTDPTVSFKYARWAPGQPTNTVINNCVSTTTSNGLWSSQPCSTNLPFLCMFQPEPPRSLCDAGWTWNQDTSSCYKVILNPSSWKAAESACVDYSAHLVSIHDVNENKFVTDLSRTGLTVLDTQQVWMGLYSGCNTCSGFFYTDSSYPGYFNWSSGQPRQTNGTDLCVQLNADRTTSQNHIGQWTAVPCDQQMRAAVCKKKTAI